MNIKNNDSLKKYDNALVEAIIAFFLASIIILIDFIIQKVGFGNKSIFSGDLFAQYYPFIADFIKCIKGESSFWYSFSNYLGSGNILNISYYCINPLNLLYLIDFLSVNTITILIIIIKIGLSAAFFDFYVKKVFNCDKFISIGLSLFYGLSGYVCALYFNIMWLDIIYMTPLLVYFIFKFVDENSYIPLIISYVYIFITNFYMAYMLGIFSFVVLVIYMLYVKNYNIKDYLRFYFIKLLKFALSVILSVGICAIVLLSSAGFLFSHVAPDNFAFTDLTAGLVDFYNCMFIGEMPSVNNQVPFLYCGIQSMILPVCFFTSKNIDIKKKIPFIAILLLLGISMLYMPLYKFMHAFDYPNYYGYRFSFLIIFVLVSIDAIMVKKIDIESIKLIKKLSLFLIVFYSFMVTFQKINYSNNSLNNQSGLLINAIFIALNVAMYLYFYFDRKKLFNIFFITLAIIEVFVNACIISKKQEFDIIDRNAVEQWYYSEGDAISSIKENDDSFYRIFVENEFCFNSAKAFNFNSLSTFSSADNYNLRMALNRLGQPTANRLISAHNIIPVFDSLFSFKYYVKLPDFATIGDDKIDKNNYLKAETIVKDDILSLGYMVNKNVFMYSAENNSFHNLNKLCKYMTNTDEEIYTDIEAIKYEAANVNVENIYGSYVFSPKSTMAFGAVVDIIVEEDSDDVYIELFEEVPEAYTASPNVSSAYSGFTSNEYASQGGVFEAVHEEGINHIQLVGDSTNRFNFIISGINAAKYNSEVFDKVYGELSKNQLTITENTGDYIKGNVEATEDKTVLFTTIPYDPEWLALVDGKASPIYKTVDDAFLALELTPGIHEVEFIYVEKYSYIGAIVTFISVIIFAMLLILNVIKKK